jgi:PAS domain S-box-containing protein
MAKASDEGYESFPDDESLYRALAESSHDAIFLIDRKHRVRYVNTFGAAFLGASAEEIKGRHLKELFPPSAYDMQSRALQAVFHSADPFFTEENLSFAERNLWIETRLVPIKNKHGSVDFVMGVTRDVTERKRTEEALRESEARFRALFDTMAEGVAVHELIHDETGTASDYVILEANRAYEEHTGIRAEDAKGKRASELYGMGKPPFIDIYSKVAETGQPHDFVTYFEPMKKYFRISVFTPGRGRFATVFDDITESSTHEEEREKLIKKLKEALGNVKVLRGMLPICASCKKVRDDKGYWKQIEAYIRDHSEAEFSHGMCPDCAKKLYPEHYDERWDKEGP